MDNKIHSVVIIGSGPAGLTAALYTGRAFLQPLVLEGPKPGGQLVGTTTVENWPGTQSIMGPRLMMDMRDHAQHFGAQFLSESAVSVDLSQHPFTITTSKDKKLKTNSIIIATGASSNTLGCPGEKEYWGKGVATCAVCDGAFYPNKKAIIVGGGDTAMEHASFMTKFTHDITVVHILDKLTASPAMQKRILDNPSINVLYNSTISSIDGDGQHVKSVTIENKKTGQKTTVDADVLFLAIGQKPNSSIFKGQLAMDQLGYITHETKTQSSVEGVFVAGDLADYYYKQAIVSAGSGCMAALDCQRYLEAKNLI